MKLIKYIKRLINRDPFTTKRKIKILTQVIKKLKNDIKTNQESYTGICFKLKCELRPEEKIHPYSLERITKIFKINFPENDNMYKWPTTNEGHLLRIAECEAAIERLKNG